METESKQTKNSEKRDFIKEYNELIDSSKNSVVIVSEWSKEGDYFKKLSMYDNNYKPIPTLGETTLIKSF
ncbi:MAG: hypothetical protein LAT76_02630 [Schleiferiaceae bacterium]|nr:hypothetical protein [Schleiferiaceae bacterium]